MARRVVVTGAQGLLGRWVVAELLHQDPHLAVLGLGRSRRRDEHFTHRLDWLGRAVAAPLPAGLPALPPDRYSYAQVDLGDVATLSAVVAEFAPTDVIHCAAALRDEPLPALLQSNVTSVATLLETVAASVPLTHVVAVSSGSVYGSPGARWLPLREDGPCSPADLYAATKRAAEDVARILAAHHDIWLVVARVFNCLGAGLQDRHLPASLAGQLAAVQLGLAPPRIRVGPLRSTRDFVDVRDAARAVVLLAEKAEPGGVYNVAGGREVPVRAIFDELLRLTGLTDRVEVDPAPMRRGDPDRSYADVARIQALGHAPLHSLEGSLRDMLAYYQDEVAVTRTAPEGFR